MRQRRVTVLMGVYNGERFLREAIDSIMGQTMPDYEFIIIDDGSTDRTPEILASYRDCRLRIVHQENSGLAKSLNRGLSMAETELVARMDADDIALPNRLELQLEEYERLGDPDVLGGHVEFIAENGYPLGTRRYPLAHNDIVARLERNDGTGILHPTVLYRRSSVLRHGGYDPFFRLVEDYDLWLRMSKDCRFCNTEHVVLRLRVNTSGMTSQELDTNRSHRTGNSWYVCVAKQRHQLEKAGDGHLWDDTECRERIVDLLWLRFAKCRTHDAFIANRALALVRADLKTPGCRSRGITNALALCLRRPFGIARYLLTRNLCEPTYLTHSDISPETTGEIVLPADP